MEVGGVIVKHSTLTPWSMWSRKGRGGGREWWDRSGRWWRREGVEPKLSLSLHFFDILLHLSTFSTYFKLLKYSKSSISWYFWYLRFESTVKRDYQINYFNYSAIHNGYEKFCCFMGNVPTISPESFEQQFNFNSPLFNQLISSINDNFDLNYIKNPVDEFSANVLFEVITWRMNYVYCTLN